MKLVSKDLTAASSKMIILSILSRKETYGYEILQSIKLFSNDGWKWYDGMIYPVLHKMEQIKLIKSRWEESEETNRKRRYYSITDKGRKVLETEILGWKLVDNTLNKILGLQTC
jgi:DNA-binding PadR family transcriptional regulator